MTWCWTVSRRTDSPSETPASSSRRPPEHKNAPPSLRPTEPALQKAQETCVVTSPSLSAAAPSDGQPTLFTRVHGFEGAGSGVRRVGRFDQVTGVWIRQDGQQVAVPRPLHHFLHLQRGRNVSVLIPSTGLRRVCKIHLDASPSVGGPDSGLRRVTR